MRPRVSGESRATASAHDLRSIVALSLVDAEALRPVGCDGALLLRVEGFARDLEAPVRKARHQDVRETAPQGL